MKMRSHIHNTSITNTLAIICAAVFVAHAPSTARAAGMVGTGTAASCTDAALNAALADGGLVTFNCGGPATIDISTGTGTKGIAADTTIDGGGLITISGGNSVQVFSVNVGVAFVVENLTIANGLGGPGGGINSDRGKLTVHNSIFRGNRSGDGGGIFNESGALTVSNSTFVGNIAGLGSGIANESGGVLPVSSTTFVGNSVESRGGGDGGGGGAVFNRGTVTVTDSAFTGNSGGDVINDSGALTIANSTFTAGDGIINLGGQLAVTSSTLTGNRSGIFSSGGTETVLRNTIVAKSSIGDNCSGRIPDGPRIVPIDGGHNLDDGTSCGFSTANGSLSNTDPQLDPAGLKDNGGPTQTVALCTAVGVPAGCTAATPTIDAGDETICAAAPVNNLDQRGFLRPGTGHTRCSIGAYEADATAAAVCVGDCGGASSVVINDLITLVNMALGNTPASACRSGVPRAVDVDVTLIIQAVNHALHGCSTPPTDPLAAAAEAVALRALREYRVTGVAMALVEGGDVVWSRGYGMADKKSLIRVDSDTVFQVASMSKAVAAWGALKLAESGALDLAKPISTYLHRWQIPASAFDLDGVTGYRLLSTLGHKYSNVL